MRTADASRKDPGRFNTAHQRALYCSLDPDTALDELRRTVERDGGSLADALPCAVISVNVSLDRVVDLGDPDALEAWGLSRQDLENEDMRRCQEAARSIAKAGAEGIRWPSAAGDGQSLAVLVDNLANDSRIEVIRVRPLSREMLQALERGGKPF